MSDVGLPSNCSLQLSRFEIFPNKMQGVGGRNHSPRLSFQSPDQDSTLGRSWDKEADQSEDSLQTGCQAIEVAPCGDVCRYKDNGGCRVLWVFPEFSPLLSLPTFPLSMERIQGEGGGAWPLRSMCGSCHPKCILTGSQNSRGKTSLIFPVLGVQQAAVLERDIRPFMFSCTCRG